MVSHRRASRHNQAAAAASAGQRGRGVGCWPRGSGQAREGGAMCVICDARALGDECCSTLKGTCRPSRMIPLEFSSQAAASPSQTCSSSQACHVTSHTSLVKHHASRLTHHAYNVSSHHCAASVTVCPRARPAADLRLQPVRLSALPRSHGVDGNRVCTSAQSCAVHGHRR